LGSAAELVDSIAARYCAGGPDQLSDYDLFPAPVYATDEVGRISYFNAASVDFAGRTPTLGVDRWCVSWKMFDPQGTEVPHDRCQMAISVREGYAVRGIEAIAERPDGSRASYRAFPTPAIDEAGRTVGGVNLLVPLDGAAERKLLATAAKCRTLAKWVSDGPASQTLQHMADQCESHAAVLRLD
jgi:PAS domain-containing protein